MFHDERIEQESGRIFRRFILIATLITAIYSILRAMPLLIYGDFHPTHFVTELFILCSGAILLTVGAIRFAGKKDERILAEMHAYFLRAGKIFLVATLTGYAFAVTFAGERSTIDVPPNHLILILEFIAVLYFFYAFKSREIPFNYSFIAEERYYTRVLCHIGKLALVLLLPFGLSAFLSVLVYQSFSYALAVLFSYLWSVLGLGIGYFLISVMEKLNDKDESARLVKAGTLIAAILFFSVLLLSDTVRVLLQYAVTRLSKEGYDGYMPLGRLVAALSGANQIIASVRTLTHSVLLCYLLFSTATKPIKRAIGLYLFSSGAGILISQAASFIYAMVKADNVDFYIAYLRFSNVLSMILAALAAISAFAVCTALCRDFSVSPAIAYLCVAKSLVTLSMVYFRTLAAQHELIVPLETAFLLLSAAYYLTLFFLLRKRDKAICQ